MKDRSPDPVADRFGPLAREMLERGPLAPVWRLSFLMNAYTGPLYAAVADRFRLSRPDFVILLCLSRQDGLVARDVARLSGLPKNSLSRAVGGLVSRQLVALGVGGEDRRAKPLQLTHEGRTLLNAAVPLFEERQAAMLSALDEAERRQLLALLDKMVGETPGWVDALARRDHRPSDISG